ncbi:ParB N-terminal domain-containing protein [Leptolyngbya sp. FACHB-261]|uniref:ParB/RepB/Spo0J family partition protein n=1 Tax=Leptolyngbya sp. FACHB-261 TaxID=2692806 RepID=UPI001685352E|nr:ParB N-terminal domain-containing protein [Leptolyngbya sp. FACHB-261]MBD2101028.1 ParB N-terminal domain-containing protein [Leptolyngbya sp. FACHB-261]
MAKRFEGVFAGRQAPQASLPSDLPSSLPLDQIKDRSQDTRTLNQQHVVALSESISVLGLIEPLVVDQEEVLLAGGHRLAAIRHLAKTEPGTFKQLFANGVPVRVMSLKVAEDPARALEIEVAENEKRRDYTPAEVRALADRLREAGYVERPGRPAKGEKALKPALEIIVGKSLRTVQAYLSGTPQNPGRKTMKRFMVSPDRAQWLKEAAQTLGCEPGEIQDLAVDLLIAKAGKWAKYGNLADLRHQLGVSGTKQGKTEK